MTTESQRDTDSLVVQPIGIARTSMKVKFETPHQPHAGEEEVHTIELFAGCNFEQALDSLAGFERIWLIWWFHKNKTWHPLVQPPRGSAAKRGVFATRSPHRPNPIGITSVQLHKIEGRTLHVGALDLLDGTPILDIKPYLPEVDAFSDVRFGWVEDIEKQEMSEPAFAVSYSSKALDQIAWLTEQQISPFWIKCAKILARDPSPHSTRRIAADRSGGFRIACGGWRLYFTVAGATVEVTSIEAGYKLEELHRWREIPDREILLKFLTTLG